MSNDKKQSDAASLAPKRGKSDKDRARIIPKYGNPDDYYVKVVKFRGRGFGFFLFCGTICAMMTIALFVNFLSNMPWIGVVVPIVLLGLLTLVYPPTEDWSYKPWQAVAQQVERHFYDI